MGGSEVGGTTWLPLHLALNYEAPVGSIVALLDAHPQVRCVWN